MPVDRAQSLVAEHGAGASGERAVLENLLVQRLDRLIGGFQFGAPDVLERVQSIEQMVGVRDLGIESAPAVSIAVNDSFISR